MELAVYILVICGFCWYGCNAVIGIQNAPVLAITRLNNGDIFTANGDKCDIDTCVGLSSGTAVLSTIEDVNAPKGSCSCQCHQHLPAFREDLHICVDDIHECILAPFVSGSTSQKIPFVFLPLKGQIIHPSKEISFTGIDKPICVVQSGQFLTEAGWKDLRNPGDLDVPFRLYIDEGRTFLQWVGEQDLRKQLSGRLVLVHLLCRELANMEETEPTEQESVFKPCVSFRVVGTPSKYLQNVSEVSFSADAQAAEDDDGSGLSISEYVAIGISSILLGLIYVASVFLYLHIRKRKRDCDKKDGRDNHSITTAEEGIIKSNPLIGLGRHFSSNDNAFSESGSSENELHFDSLQEERKKTFQLTSALIHPQQSYYEASMYSSKSMLDYISHEMPSIERLPEENVAIVETIEGREERSDTVKAITGTTRRKLYFNPAYFEPELLLAPPPAALEFLIKIREVITIAKQKMACKRYNPSLIEIPEEESDNSSAYDEVQSPSRKSSVVNLKRENSRLRFCGGCPGCNTKDLKDLYGKLPEYPSIRTCKNCSLPVNDSKQRIIQKWLEDVPVLKSTTSEVSATNNEVINKAVKLRKHLRSPTRSLSPVNFNSSFRTVSPRPASERARSPSVNSMYDDKSISARSQPCAKPRRSKTREHPVKTRRKIPVKPRAPPPTLPVECDRKTPSPARLAPDMINETSATDKPNKTRMPTITRQHMKAVINEFAVQHGLSVQKASSSSPSPEMLIKRKSQYESDSLDRSRVNKGFSTPTEYMEVSSSQPSPSLSGVLPMTEELTIRNTIMTHEDGTKSLKHSKDVELAGLEDYEVIIVKKDDPQTLIQSTLYKLPELLQRSNGYSLVSEVYVNNGYNFGSLPSSPCESPCSTLNKKRKVKKYEQPEDKPGPLTIEVEDCPDNYIRVDDSDNFEPDTLDRKSQKTSLSRFVCTNRSDEFIDSLERPNKNAFQIRGSFKNDALANKPVVNSSNFTRKFGSLREIYEFKTKNNLRNSTENLSLFNVVKPKNEEKVTTWKYGSDEYEGRLLTLEERHSRRQRCIVKPTSVVIPPDIIPPPHNNLPIYEHPKPPRKVMLDSKKPPLPPKNGGGRSTSQKRKDDTRASPTSEKSYGIASSCLSGASVSPYSSDYETFQIGEQRYLNESDMKALKKLITSDQVMIKNAVNRMQTSSLKKETKKEDLNNNEYYNSDNEKNAQDIKKSWLKIINQSPNYCRVPFDSGYLSTDSYESPGKKQGGSEKEVSGGGSETDESLGDGHSESGAESVETHSVFFGVYNKPIENSGKEVRGKEDEYASTDSETFSYATVVPISSARSSLKRKSLRSSLFLKK